MRTSLNILLFTMLVSAGTLSAQMNYTLSNDHSFTIIGGSNLHAWSETANKVEGFSNITWNKGGDWDLNTLNLKVDVQSIKSTEGSQMNDKTYTALKSDQNPTITFILTSPIHSIQLVNGGSMVTATGNLTIAGVTRLVDIQATVIADKTGKFIFQGSKQLKMTDYGIKLPTALFGVLKVTDNITIDFKTTFYGE